HRQPQESEPRDRRRQRREGAGNAPQLRFVPAPLRDAFENDLRARRYGSRTEKRANHDDHLSDRAHAEQERIGGEPAPRGAQLGPIEVRVKHLFHGPPPYADSASRLLASKSLSHWLAGRFLRAIFDCRTTWMPSHLARWVNETRARLPRHDIRTNRH